jgi:hypothetical protein
MRIRSVLPLLVTVPILGCTGSPATLALRPDFELMTRTGIASVSIRESPPGMTDAEFARVIAQGMKQAMPGSVMITSMTAPFPPGRIVWHVNPVAARGVVRLVVNAFDGSGPFAYEQQSVDNSAQADVIQSTIAEMTIRLNAALDQHYSHAPA